jgi:prephenate dehydratase
MRSVAIQGTKGSYSEEAALKILGQKAKIQGFSSFFETFQALLIKNVDYAVIPVKNTIIGEISSALRLFEQSDLKVLEEFPILIEHVLVGTKNTRFEQIRTVRSHIAALEQCQDFFLENNQIQKIIGADTASSIKRIISEDKVENAAIGSPRAAKLYGGKILTQNIANQKVNQTTFYLIENKPESVIC